MLHQQFHAGIEIESILAFEHCVYTCAFLVIIIVNHSYKAVAYSHPKAVQTYVCYIRGYWKIWWFISLHY